MAMLNLNVFVDRVDRSDTNRFTDTLMMCHLYGPYLHELFPQSGSYSNNVLTQYLKAI